ncbi:hypothetical protein [Arenimonas caeni]|uniref:Uncharacterized protein n=1 Tax=Arenimonas caeni TaxID=2058085 RepID=A0A2P6MAB0_9GAMM|nr:hypothetical protein [Arenimonas caeni]PRH82917.1 hypothetical protein C6N40_04540 [Arenimonas caeni]
MKRLATLLIALSALLAPTGCARADVLVDVHVVDLDRHETLVRHPHRGKQWIEGRPGHRYALRLQNLTGQRVLAVVSVDGVNVISGETAGTGQAGYVLEPWQSLEVAGWRKSLSEVAGFHFTDLPDSYAARTGRPGNVGVIGVAAFRERQHRPLPPPAPIAQSKPAGAADAAPAMERERHAAGPARQQLGTGHGERRRDAATLTRFERASMRPESVVSLYYDSHEALVARGVLPGRRPWHRHEPEAFPVGFVPDPR